MKKSLIALAALAAVSAASAQSSVTLYGLVDVGYGTHNSTSRDGTVFTKSRGVMDGSNAGNRIGFRGTEDLGGGLKANFVVEQGISPTSTTVFSQRAAGPGHQIIGLGAGTGVTGSNGGGFSTATNRQSYLGLSSSSLGTLNIGYTYTNAYELGTLSGYMVGSEQVGGAAHIAGSSAAGNFVGGNRANGLTYISPNFGGGFVVRAQYGAGTGLESITANANSTNGLTTENLRRMSLMLQYANGPLSVALAHTTARSLAVSGSANGNVGTTVNQFGVVVVNGNSGSTGVALTPAQLAAGVLTGQSRTGNLTQLGASYDFGVAKLGATYNTGKSGGSATSTDNTTVRAYQVGVSVPFGAIVPYLMVGREVFKNQGTGVDAANVRTAQMGVRYSLSKRTTAYAMYGQEIDNAVVAAAGAGYKATKTVVGVSHSF